MSSFRFVVDVVATAGRDGNIHIYDLRFSSRNNASSTSAEITALSKKIKMPTGYVHRGLREGAEEGQVWPVITIKNAHADNGGKQVKGVSDSFTGVTSQLTSGHCAEIELEERYQHCCVASQSCLHSFRRFSQWVSRSPPMSCCHR